MKVAEGKQEAGIEVGNHFDKYASKNPIVKWMMNGFLNSLDSLIAKTGEQSIHEIGCGEGVLSLRLIERGYQVRGCDFSEIAVRLARQNAIQRNVNSDFFQVKSIYDLNENDVAPLVMCCEVLEHLEQPNIALKNLAKIAKPWLILSVPREPIWSILNMARGKYWSDLGNTPGHIQQWSADEFIKMVSEVVEVVEVKNPFPWTMLLCKAKSVTSKV